MMDAYKEMFSEMVQEYLMHLDKETVVERAKNGIQGFVSNL